MTQRNNTVGKVYDQLPGEDICWVGYLYPFTMIVPDGESPLAVPLDEINNNSYDNGKLCRIIGNSPVADLPNLGVLISACGRCYQRITHNLAMHFQPGASMSSGVSG